MISWALLGLGLYLALLDPHLVTLLTLEGNGYLKMAHTSKLLRCTIFVSDFCAACTISQDLTVFL